jgi:hypothetical protein
MKTVQIADNLQGHFFDPLSPGELKHCNFQGIPWTTGRFGKLLFGEERKFLHNAVLKLIELEYQATAFC